MTRVYRAKGLVAADMGGTSDPYCVLELDNTRVTKRTQIEHFSISWKENIEFLCSTDQCACSQVATHTEYKTLEPAWHRVFELQATNDRLFLTIS